LINDTHHGRTPATDDGRAYVRGELRALSAQIVAAMPRASDRATRLHLEDARDQIAKALDPKVLPTAAAAAAGPARPGLEADELEQMLHPTICWPDYAIRVKQRQ
jgi:hypothetical protein